MTFLTKPNELKSVKTLKGLILGDTNNGKTTLALSAPNPVLIDFEGGLSRVSKQWQTISMQVKDFADLINFITSKEVNQFKTIVIDPLGEMADQIKAYVIEENPKIATDSRKLFPAIASEFKKMWTLLKNKNLSIIFVSHTDEVMKDNVESLKIRCEGSFIKGFIPTQVDFVTILRRVDEKGKTKRYLDFAKNPSFTFAKRWAELEEQIEVPNLKPSEKNDFLEKVIFEKWKEKCDREDKANQEYDILIEKIKNDIDKIKNLEDINNYYSAVYNKHENLWSSYQIEGSLLQKKSEEINCEFDKQNKIFKLKEATEAKEVKTEIVEDKKKVNNKRLTNEDLGKFYNKKTGGSYVKRDMFDIMNWASEQPEIFVDNEGYYYFKEEYKQKTQ